MLESLEQKKARLRELRLAKEAEATGFTPPSRRQLDIDTAKLAAKLHLAMGGGEDIHPVLKTAIIRGARAAGIDTKL